MPDRIFVAKSSGKQRGNRYISGLYRPTTNDSAVDVYDESVVAPGSIVDLVQWCTCDVMLSRGATPLAVLEDTTHIVRMNLYQRIPRLARAASLGVPSVSLQGTRGLDFAMRGDRWALYRFLQAFEGMGRLFTVCPPLPFYYLATGSDELEAEGEALGHLLAIINGDHTRVAASQAATLADIRGIMADGVDGDIPPDIPSIDHAGPEVIVKIGARPHVKSWRAKGSGQMDPYVGMIAAAKYIYCFDAAGSQVKPLVVEFTFLPEGFWFFKDAENATALYKRLPYEFADEVRFLG